MARVENVGETQARHLHDRPLRGLTDEELTAITDAERALSAIAKDSVRLPLATVSYLAGAELNERDYQERMSRV